MPDADDINDAIADNATGPKRMKVGQEEAEQHSIKDQIAAAQHVASQSATSQPHFGLRMSRQVPPGCG